MYYTTNRRMKLIHKSHSFSISGSGGPIYAYLAEVHSIQYRSKSIMYASVVYGIISVFQPVLAWLVINQSWQISLPFIDVMFAPWRLYIIVCAIPSLICYICFFFLPESPKFILGQGKQQEAIHIVQQIHRWNCGEDAETLTIHEIFDETATKDQRQNGNQSLLGSVWTQTAPIFMKPYLKNTVLISVIQFSLFAGSNGMLMWFPDILNRMAINEKMNPGEQVGMCEVVYRTRTNLTISVEEMMVSPQVSLSSISASNGGKKGHNSIQSIVPELRHGTGNINVSIHYCYDRPVCRWLRNPRYFRRHLGQILIVV